MKHSADPDGFVFEARARKTLSDFVPPESVDVTDAREKGALLGVFLSGVLMMALILASLYLEAWR